MHTMKKSLILGLLLLSVLLASLISLALYQSHAAGVPGGVNQNCTLVVPPNPLTAQGLATTYHLRATHPEQGKCHEDNIRQSVFVQAAILDPATGTISIYNPLVVDAGKHPPVKPIVPHLPQGAVVALWFGGNDNVTTLANTHPADNCVNGTPGSPFGQFAYCNAVAFFQAANAAIAAGKLVVPPLGTANDGLPCPTVRDFSVVDQDQSDNLTTTYLAIGRGNTVQNTAANQARFPNATKLTNGSDNALLTAHIDDAIGCKPFMAPDLTNGGAMTAALPLNELQAAAFQKAPIALVPVGDPMVQVNGMTNLNKTNLYRVGVDQPKAATVQDANTTDYCTNLRTGANRLALDAKMTNLGATPDVAVGNTLFTFLAARYVGSYQQLNCQGLTGMADPVVITQMVNGAATAATINGVNPLA